MPYTSKNDRIKKVAEYQKLNRDKVKLWKRKTAIKRLYKITWEQYQELIRLSEGVCGICKLPDKRALSIDHCHKTGKVRGLLCRDCNRGLGFFKDSQIGLQKALAYLQRDEVLPLLGH